MGTAHVLAAINATPSVQATVVVTSDKVYANNESGRAFHEDDQLGGRDPYSASKACAELVVASWARTASSPVATARAGNVIGGGDRGADRLLVDIEAALRTDAPIEIRQPTSTRPWQFVLDPLAGYVRLAEELLADPEKAPRAVNFGPHRADSPDVQAMVELVLRTWGHGTWHPAAEPGPPEAVSLALDSTLARHRLGWQARVPLETGLRWTVDWWRAAAAGESLVELGTKQMADFEAMCP
jgi:CDP-glucose 4,6-dehydratase